MALKGIVLLLLVTGIAGAARAGVVVPPQLPPPAYADTEVSESLSLPAWGSDIRTFRFTLDFHATPSNNVQIAFGKDADGDGVLSPGETGMAMGWDCGAWFVRLFPDGEAGIATNAVAAGGRKTLAFGMRLRGGDAEGPPDIRDGGAALFTELAAEHFARMHDKAWDRMRLTARGVDVPGEWFEVARSPDGFSIILR